MQNEFTALIENTESGTWVLSRDSRGKWPGLTREDCQQNLAEAVKLILEDRLEVV